MRKPDQSDLMLLTEPRAGPCVSLFLPTTPHGGALQEDQARLRVLLRRAESRLDRRVAAQVLGPLRELADGEAFRTSRDRGLAAFAATGFQFVVSLPHPLDEHFAVGPAFEVGRLLPAVQDDGTFHVLAVSRSGARLLRCTCSTVERVPLPGVPAGMEAALAADDPERSVQFHSGSGPAAKGAPVYHGQGSAKDADADRLRRWMLLVAKGAAQAIGPNAGPVVAALVADQLPVLRGLDRIPGLLPDAIAGNPDRVDDARLRDRAWPLVRPHFREALRKRLHAYWGGPGRHRVACDVDAVVAAAHDGRVDTLFVARGAHRFGRIESEGGTRVVLHERAEDGDVDVLEYAISETIGKGGRAYAVDPVDVPDHGEAAALLRY